MDASSIHWVFEILGGIVMFLLQSSYSDLKEQLKESKKDINSLRESKMDKDEFKEFKTELWHKLDKIEFSVEKLRDEKN